MKANELRIGNYYLSSGKQISQANGMTISDLENKSILIEPIPLTEEWLLKFGFKGPKNQAGKYYELNKHRVYIFENSFEFEFNSHDDARFNLFRSYKYVHQLQNLYFALTGQELTVK